MFHLLAKLQRCPLTFICDDVETAHCVPIALQKVAQEARHCCFVSLEHSPAWFDQFEPAQVINALPLLMPEAAGQFGWQPLRDHIQLQLVDHTEAALVLHSASALIHLLGLQAFRCFLAAAAAIPAVQSIVCVLHCDSHPIDVLAAVTNLCNALLIFSTGAQASPFGGTAMQGCRPLPPPLPDVKYDVCCVSLVRRPLQRDVDADKAAPKDAARAPQAPKEAACAPRKTYADRSVGRLLGHTEYFVLQSHDGALSLEPVDWKKASQAPAPVGPNPSALAAVAPSSLAADILKAQSHDNVPFSLELTAAERTAKEAVVLPYTKGGQAQTGVIYVDADEFDDDLDDDLDI